MTVDPYGPMLVEGPVEVVLDDGTTVRSDRFVVAVCACRRSRTYPWCDTSHRRRSRPAPEAPHRTVTAPCGGTRRTNGDPEQHGGAE